MTHAELERDVAAWLRADAAAVAVPGALRQRILDIPTASPARRGWLSRFWPILAAPAAASAAMAGVLAIVLFFGLFDAPPGADGEPCNRRQTQAGLDSLRDADGYRFVIRYQTTDLDRDRVTSLEDPAWGWTDATVQEGAYLAPDRFVMRATRDAGGVLERRQTADGHWELWSSDGEPRWVVQEPWPTANAAWGHVQNAMPTAMIPAVSTLGFGADGVDLDTELPGSGGCIAVAELPQDIPTEIDEIDGMPVVVPDGVIPTRYLGLRVDPASARAVSLLIGPAGEITRQALTRTIIELTWERADPGEFSRPADTLPPPDDDAPPPPTPSPLVIGEEAWVPEVIEGSGERSTIAAVTAAGARIVAAGINAAADDTRHGTVWLSDDGLGWRAVTPDGWDRLWPQSMAWDGSQLLLVGLRVTDDGADPAAEVWRSPDGDEWERLATLEPGAQPSRLVTGGPGWVLTGSTATGPLQMRPSIWTSADGRQWTEAELAGTASGRFGPVTSTASGELIVTGCESPDDPAGPQSGTGACYTRLWRSDDGTSWTADAILPIELHEIAGLANGLLAIGTDPDAPMDPDTGVTPGAVWQSSDGVTWTPVDGFDSGDAGPGRLHQLGDELVATGSRMNFTAGGGYAVAAAWESIDGVAWELIELGLLGDSIGSEIGGVVDTDDGRVFVGHVVRSETESVVVVWRHP